MRGTPWRARHHAPQPALICCLGPLGTWPLWSRASPQTQEQQHKTRTSPPERCRRCPLGVLWCCWGAEEPAAGRPRFAQCWPARVRSVGWGDCMRRHPGRGQGPLTEHTRGCRHPCCSHLPQTAGAPWSRLSCAPSSPDLSPAAPRCQRVQLCRTPPLNSPCVPGHLEHQQALPRPSHGLSLQNVLQDSEPCWRLLFGPVPPCLPLPPPRPCTCSALQPLPRSYSWRW